MAKPIVAFLDRHAPAVLAVIAAEAPTRVELHMAITREPSDLRNMVADAEFFVGGVEPIHGDLIDAAPRLRLIHKWGIGVDKIDLAAARRRGISVAITAGGNAVPVAEFTLLLMLAVLRRLPHRQDQLRDGAWDRSRAEARVESFQLRGKVVGLVGFGAVGREVARRVQAFDAEVRYFDVRRLTPEEEATRGVTFRALDDLLAEVDILSLHAPVIDSTRGLLSRARIARLKRGAILINAARGELIDETALVEALQSGHLAGAGIDVFDGEPPRADNPLLVARLPGLVVAPHIAGSVFDNVANVARHVFGNVERVLDGQPIPASDLV
jgi:D-3-phosphoglycerate dehydrogenase